MVSFCLMIMMMIIRGFLAPGRTIWTMGMHDHTYILLMAIRMVRMGEEGGGHLSGDSNFQLRQHIRPAALDSIHSFILCKAKKS